jgi:predicted XRE-type DNA-binding protein
MPRKRDNQSASPHITKGNVLNDIGFSPAEALAIKVKADIYRELLEYIRERQLTPQQLESLLGIHQPDVSNLMNGKISKFSIAKLIKFAGMLDLGAQVRITRPAGPFAISGSRKFTKARANPCLNLAARKRSRS